MKKNQNNLCYFFAFFPPKFLHFCRMTHISELRVRSRPSIRKQQGGPVFVALGGALLFCVLSWDERRLSMQVDFVIRRHGKFVVVTRYK